MPGVGFGPTRPFGQGILSPQRLPVPPPRHGALSISRLGAATAPRSLQAALLAAGADTRHNHPATHDRTRSPRCRSTRPPCRPPRRPSSLRSRQALVAAAPALARGRHGHVLVVAAPAQQTPTSAGVTPGLLRRWAAAGTVRAMQTTMRQVARRGMDRMSLRRDRDQGVSRLSTSSGLVCIAIVPSTARGHSSRGRSQYNSMPF
jgi:hypothetical protein